MGEAIKSFETVDRNSKGNLSHVLKKCMLIFIKYLIVTKTK